MARLSDLIDVRPFLDGYRVSLGAQTIRECRTLSAAARAASDASDVLRALERQCFPAPVVKQAAE